MGEFVINVHQMDDFIIQPIKWATPSKEDETLSP